MASTISQTRNQTDVLAMRLLASLLTRAGTWQDETGGAGNVICLLSVLMKPEHQDRLDTIWRKLDQATDVVGEKMVRNG